MTKKADLPRNPGVPRRNNTQQILNAAEKIFSAYGFAGARIDDIAKACDLPKANILYYFGSKEELYRATLQRLLVGWLADADQWISIKHTPAVGLEGYIRSKMAFSRSKPDASRLFMHELLAGGERVRAFLDSTLREHVEQKAVVFDYWHKQGLCAPVDSTHFMFTLWSMTQAYADMQVQFAAVLGRRRLNIADFEKGISTILQLAGSICLTEAAADTSPQTNQLVHDTTKESKSAEKRNKNKRK